MTGLSSPLDVLRLLIIEDNLVDATMVQALLAEELGTAHSCAWVRTLEEGLAALEESTPSCVLLDLGLPDSDGLATLEGVLAVVPETAIVVFTGLDEDRVGREAVAYGAQDYLVKTRTDANLLARSIRHAVERKQAETTRRHSEDRFRLAIEGMPDPVFITSSVRDRSGEIIDFNLEHVNTAGCEFLSRPHNHIVGRTLLEIVPELPGELLASFREVVDSGEPLITRQSYPGPPSGRDHVALAVDLRAVRFGDGFLLSTHDITDLMRAEDALRMSEERFRGLIEHSSDIIFVVDAASDFLYVSPAASQLLGYEPQALIGTASFDLLHPSDLPQMGAAFTAILSNSVSNVRLTHRVRHSSGTWRWVETIANNRLEDPSIRGLVLNARDVTEQMCATTALDDVNRVLRTLTAADNAIVRATDEGLLLDDMCQLIMEVGGYPRAWIVAPDPVPSSGIGPVPAREDDDNLFADLIGASAGALDDPVSAAAHLGQTRVVADIGEFLEGLPEREAALAQGYQSLIALPLHIEDAGIGSLAIYASEPDAFDAEEISLLEQLAANLAHGITALRTRIERQGYFEQVERSLDALIETIGTTLEYRDPYTAGHQRRVAELAARIAQELALDDDVIAGIKMAASIHDIGKISTPAEILSKPGRLSAAELELVKEHPRVGYEIVKHIEFQWPVPEVILQHHERFDGSGYPAGLIGREISLGARIVAVADTVEAMCSHRPYRPGWGLSVALCEIEDQRGTLFDPEIVDACLRVFREGDFSFEPGQAPTAPLVAVPAPYGSQ